MSCGFSHCVEILYEGWAAGTKKSKNHWAFVPFDHLFPFSIVALGQLGCGSLKPSSLRVSVLEKIH